MTDVIPGLLLGSVGLYALFMLLQRWKQDRRAYLQELAGDPAYRSPAEVNEVITQENLLLLRVLRPAQMEMYRGRGYFDLQAASGRRYRISGQAAYNIAELDSKGLPTTYFCITTLRFTSIAGMIAAQVLLLSTDEAAFRKIANKSKRAP